MRRDKKTNGRRIRLDNNLQEGSHKTTSSGGLLSAPPGALDGFLNRSHGWDESPWPEGNVDGSGDEQRQGIQTVEVRLGSREFTSETFRDFDGTEDASDLQNEIVNTPGHRGRRGN
jgi:hypothetical protein